MTSSQEQEQEQQNVVDPVPDSFRGVLASLQHVVPKWQRLQNFTSAAKSAPSSKSNQNPRSASNQNYASTGDLRVLCAMGGGVGELHDNALRDYFFTELASNSSAFSKSADDLLFVVVPNAVSCPKNNYPIPVSSSSSSNSNQNNNSDSSTQNNNKNDSASDTATPSSIGTGASQSSPSVGNKIAGAFKMFGKKISNLVSSNKNSNSDDQQQNSSSSSNNNNDNNNKDFPSSPFQSQQNHEAMLEKLRQMAPDFLSLVTSTHLCADSHDPIAAGEYSIKSSTILVFRRGTNPLQTAVEKAMEYVKAYDAMLNNINGGVTPSGGSRAGSVRQCSSGNLSNQANTGNNRNSSRTLLHDSNENMNNNADDNNNNNNNDDDEDDELRRSTKHSSHQAYLADPPIRRLSSTDFDAGNNSSPNESPNPTQQGQFGTNSSDTSASASLAAVPPTPPNYSQLLSIPREPNWFATVALNLSCQWPFYLNVAVVKMLRSTDLSPSNSPTPVAIRTVQRQVYPTLQPPRNIRAGGNFKGRDDREATNMFSESESSTTSFSYPDLHFSVDDFEEAFGDIRLAPGHKLAVLLTAGGPPNTDSEAVAVFRGVVNYENLMQQLKKQEQATGVALSSHPGASNNNSSHFGAPGGSSSGQFGSPSMAMKMNAPASPPAVVPLKSQSGRAEVAIWLTEADLEAQRFMQAHQQQQQQQDDEDHNNNEHGDNNNKNNKKNVTMGLQGTEILHCALTRVSLHASHVVSAMLQGVPWSSLHASWLPKQSNNPVTRNKWMIFPPTKEHLTTWLEDDNGFNRARAAAGTGTTSDDVRKMLGSGD